jgi:PKD repeat protein
MMIKKLVLVAMALAIALLGVMGCAAGKPEEVPPSTPMPYPTAAPTPKVPPPGFAGPAESRDEAKVAGEDEVNYSVSGEIDRMIVRSGDISLVVEDVSITIDQIAQLAEDLGGYVVSSKRWGQGKKTAGAITIRVPAEDFDSAMRAMRRLAVEVTSEGTSSKDVTEEYVDLTSKLGNLEATEAQLLKLMEKAETVEGILNVQKELSKTRGEIEQTKGRMQYLERTSATSLIRTNLEQAKLDAEFTASKTTAKEREEIQFYSKVSGGFAPYSYEWDFGDGATSTGENPTHAYRAEGSYTVSLKVTDDRANTVSKPRDDYIAVLPGWSAGSVLDDAWSGLVTFSHAIGTAAIWLGIFCWLWIPPLVIWLRRRRKKSQ